MSARGFGELEAVIMDRVWNCMDPTTVREVFEELSAEREIAYTTVLSTMDNLHRKGWLDRERVGKAFRYWPTLSREQYGAQMMREALSTGGRSDLVLANFVDEITPEQAEGLRAALRRRRGSGHPG
ncbi:MULTISPECIES: BlaI/MecI/CopY family transcriptional regulator [Nocardia]|uniref:BlaI/MecI/CopY family transcriptional regulator n=1 Tax=Nocardia TaxID=1817 RepID=UPI0005C132EE|nr:MULTISPECIES: BlaI/MecI/CopY family transcriptional regulator [Nocardia]